MRIQGILCVGVMAALIAASVSAAGPKTQFVDCDAGDTIANALKKKGDPLTIEINGICVENVIVRRDNVHFVGTSSATDGVQAADDTEPFSAAVTLREARNITFEHLQFSGGSTAGLRTENSRRNISADNCLFQDNGTWGVIAVGGVINVTNSSITNNASGGLAVGESGQIYCGDCSILDNPNLTTGSALSARTGGIISLENTIVDGSRSAAVAQGSGQIFVTTSDITADASAVLATDHASIVVDTSSLDGRILATNKARVQLFDVTQVGGFGNFIDSDSYLEIFSTAPGASSFSSAFFLTGFSEGTSFGATTFDAIDCSPDSNLTCDGSESKVSSSCGFCP